MKCNLSRDISTSLVAQSLCVKNDFLKWKQKRQFTFFHFPIFSWLHSDSCQLAQMQSPPSCMPCLLCWGRMGLSGLKWSFIKRWISINGTINSGLLYQISNQHQGFQINKLKNYNYFLIYLSIEVNLVHLSLHQVVLSRSIFNIYQRPAHYSSIIGYFADDIFSDIINFPISM